jgi:hypothetical protein
MKREAEQDVS